ncbi:MAG: 4-(cytidine 5'-diphospho)-2-C-methyl-D-erythritol kinase [Pseudolabrys sp.]
MTAPLSEQAPAKINLSLRVVGRRADGYHELESLVVFARLADRLTLSPDGEAALAVSGPFAGQCGPAQDNLVLKAAAALRARVPDLTAGRFALEKNLPVAAGIGGGSADAAAALRLLARQNGIAADDPRLAEAALQVGADVPVCLAARPRLMRGIGEQLSAPLSLPKLAAVLANPGVPLGTREVFARFTLKPRAGAGAGAERVPEDVEGLLAFLAAAGNDLTEAAIACAPVIADVLDALGALPGARLARMSGSGATCFALFASVAEAEAAGRRLGAAHPDWWVAATQLG